MVKLHTLEGQRDNQQPRERKRTHIIEDRGRPA